MTYEALMADSSHTATAYMIVMDGTKSLADPIPQCLFRARQGNEQWVMERHDPKDKTRVVGLPLECHQGGTSTNRLWYFSWSGLHSASTCYICYVDKTRQTKTHGYEILRRIGRNTARHRAEEQVW